MFIVFIRSTAKVDNVCVYCVHQEHSQSRQCCVFTVFIRSTAKVGNVVCLLCSSGARPKTSVNSREHQPLTQNGYIHVTQSGALPCKALIHVDLEHYFSQDYSAPVKASMKTLMEDVFRQCKHHHFTSLAVPVIGVDETWDCPVPIDEASEAIVSCFIDLEDRGGIDQAWYVESNQLAEALATLHRIHVVERQFMYDYIFICCLLFIL